LNSQRHIRAALVVLLVSLTSCGGGDSGTDVVDNDPSSLELFPDTLRLASAGDTGTIGTTVRNAGGSTIDGVAVTFTTNDPGVASVGVSSGLVTAEGDGATMISAEVAPGGPNLTKSIRIEVGGSLEPAYLVGGNVGVAYSDQVGPATGGGGTFTYAITAGALPNGLTLNAATAQIAGVPSASGAYFFEVTATNGVLTLSERYAITISTKSSSAFNLWIAYNGGPLPPVNARSALNQALTRWEEIVTGDVGPTGVTYPPTGLTPQSCQLVDASLLNGAFIEDVAILMAVNSIDGPNKTLARGGPCGYGRQQRPAVITGQMLLDEDDLLATTTYLRDVIWHEIAHVLGVGTLWQDSTVFFGTDSVSYFGKNGKAEWIALGGSGNVPVEPEVGGHWDEAWFDGEIMTPSAEGLLSPHPISRMTIGAVLDLGWSAVLGEADAYSLPLCSSACSVPARVAGPETIPDVVRDRLLPLPPGR